MKYALLIFLTLSVSHAYSQHVKLSPDSSAILFPGDVYVSLRPEVAGNDFLLSENSLNVLLIQCNYLFDMNKHFSTLLDVYKKQLLVLDSIQQVSTAGRSISQQRIDLYSQAYSQSKQITEKYDKQVHDLISDLSSHKRQQRKEKRISFLKGAATGLTFGILAGAVSLVLIE